jgi:hypothetical protein
LIGTATAADHQVIGIVNDERLQTLFVSELLPSQHESAHIQIAEQGTDRRSLWSSPASIPIARTPPLVVFFNWNFQPHLEQMQHRPIDDPSSHRLHQFGVWNVIEVATEIRVNNLSMANVEQLMDLSDSIQ